VRGFFESEGCNSYGKQGWSIEMSNGDDCFLKFTQNFLSELGIKSNIWKRSNGVNSLGIVGGDKERRKFVEKINPVIKNEVY